MSRRMLIIKEVDLETEIHVNKVKRMINSLGATKEQPMAVQRVTGKKTHIVQGSHKIDNYSLGWY